MLERLDASAVRDWALAAALALEARRAEIDDLNVFPIADADTGTNLAMTVRAGADAVAAALAGPAAGSVLPLSGSAYSAGQALAELARGAVFGARGNSGVIIAQLLRGMAEAVQGSIECDASTLQRALGAAATQAYAAVNKPQEGTILTVARAAADAARDLPPAALSLDVVITAALSGALEALRRTPEQLPVLARAGVIDAGGLGLVVMLDALCVLVTGVPSARSVIRRPPRSRQALEGARESGSQAYAYEIQYLLQASEPAVARLRLTLAACGDSLAVVGTGEDVWNVHVHANDVGAVLEAGIEAGRPYRITVLRFADQIADQLAVAAGAEAAAGARDRRTTADEPASDRQFGGVSPETGPVTVLALVASAGLAQLFDGHGAHVIAADSAAGSSADSHAGSDGAGAAAVEAAVLEVLRSTGASRAVILPTDEHLGVLADRAARHARTEGIEVAVVPTRSPVQGLAALAVHDARRRADDDVIAMAEAAAATHFAEISIAEQAGLTTIGPCRAGDVLGLIDGDVVEIGVAISAVCLSVLNRLLGTGGELITVVLGADAPPDTEASIRRQVMAHSALIEVVSYAAEQANCPILIGME